jgi:putative peptidoglycan lipid II flippase|tara:strand:- start:4006 stop:5487 length:1482 start_codon:yes stop_codon:yes gene_type:complete
MFAGFGAGPYLSAYLVAFTLPNLLRRLVGEGALTSAVIPVLSERLESGGKAASFDTLNRVLSRLFLALLFFSILGIGLLIALSLVPGVSLRWLLAERLGALLLPYCIFVCAGAIVGAQLNILQRFMIPALGSVWLNIVMIVAIGLGLWLMPGSVYARLVLLCVAVLLGGFLQYIIPAFALRREGWTPRLDGSRDESLTEVWRLLLPGMAGAAILQVNLLIARLLALSIDDAATSILYLANRLVELPYGVFAVAITTVAFPRLARAVAQKDESDFRSAYEQGRTAIFLITLPAAVGLFVLAEPILITLFEWGLFDSRSVLRTVLPLQILAISMPFFSWTMLATRGLHSWKKMKLPMRVAGVNVVINLVLGLWLMRYWGVVGLAVANLAASVVVALLLEAALWKRGVVGVTKQSVWGLAKMAVACALMAAVVLGSWRLILLLELSAKPTAVLLVLLGIPLGALTYLGGLHLLGVPELKELQARLFENFGRKVQAD